MQVVRWLWTMDFLLFSLLLLFVWSKKVILEKKVSVIGATLDKIEVVEGRRRPAEPAPEEPESSS